MIHSTRCGGCGKEPEFDHYHQYISVLKQAVSCWCINGRVYKSLFDAVSYVAEILDCSRDEAGTYIQNLRKVYG